MKLTVNPDKERIELKVQATDMTEKVVYLPTDKVYYWYPFNINFYYKYSQSEQRLYLVKGRGYTGKNYYKVNGIKRTKPLSERNGIVFNPNVYMRNKYIMDKAKSLGLPTIKKLYTLKEIEKGFADLDVLIQTLRHRLEDRVLESESELELEQATLHDQELDNEEWDEQVYSVMTEEEKEELEEYGEMYAMLNLMKKLAERKN